MGMLWNTIYIYIYNPLSILVHGLTSSYFTLDWDWTKCQGTDLPGNFSPVVPAPIFDDLLLSELHELLPYHLSTVIHLMTR